MSSNGRGDHPTGKKRDEIIASSIKEERSHWELYCPWGERYIILFPDGFVRLMNGIEYVLTSETECDERTVDNRVALAIPDFLRSFENNWSFYDPSKPLQDYLIVEENGTSRAVK